MLGRVLKIDRLLVAAPIAGRLLQGSLFEFVQGWYHGHRMLPAVPGKVVAACDVVP